MGTVGAPKRMVALSISAVQPHRFAANISALPPESCDAAGFPPLPSLCARLSALRDMRNRVGLTDDLQVPHDRVDPHPVGEKTVHYRSKRRPWRNDSIEPPVMTANRRPDRRTSAAYPDCS